MGRAGQGLRGANRSPKPSRAAGRGGAGRRPGAGGPRGEEAGFWLRAERVEQDNQALRQERDGLIERIKERIAGIYRELQALPGQLRNTLWTMRTPCPYCPYRERRDYHRRHAAGTLGAIPWPISTRFILENTWRSFSESANTAWRKCLIGTPPRRINEIVHGRRSITADTAVRLGQALGITPEFRLNLENLYDLDLARAINRPYRKYRIIGCSPIATHLISSNRPKGRRIPTALTQAVCTE